MVSWGESHTRTVPAATARKAGLATRLPPRTIRVVQAVATIHAARGTATASSTSSTRRMRYAKQNSSPPHAMTTGATAAPTGLSAGTI